MYFKAFIRIIKSLNETGYYDISNQIVEPLIEAKDKDEVKSILLKKYPQFFQNNKVYEKETKDKAQFFYVIIYPLWNNEIELLSKGEWICDYCGQKHENRIVVRPHRIDKLFPDKLFCPSENDYCLNEFKKQAYKDIDMIDNELYIKSDSPIYIYKITEKLTGKSYIGKTKNEPFFRWWDHLKRNFSEFGIYFRSTKINQWTFEVIEILPYNTKDSEVFRIESEYIIKFDSIKNGFNSVISNKSVMKEDNQYDLFK